MTWVRQGWTRVIKFTICESLTEGEVGDEKVREKTALIVHFRPDHGWREVKLGFLTFLRKRLDLFA